MFALHHTWDYSQQPLAASILNTVQRAARGSSKYEPLRARHPEKVRREIEEIFFCRHGNGVEPATETENGKVRKGHEKLPRRDSGPWWAGSRKATTRLVATQVKAVSYAGGEGPDGNHGQTAAAMRRDNELLHAARKDLPTCVVGAWEVKMVEETTTYAGGVRTGLLEEVESGKKRRQAPHVPPGRSGGAGWIWQLQQLKLW
jgi:hypothetical protein